MRRSTLKILACPMCRAYPLRLIVFKQNRLDGEAVISEGVLKCPKCARWYPIIDEIPRMLPDDMRPDYGKFISIYGSRILKQQNFR